MLLFAKFALSVLFSGVVGFLGILWCGGNEFLARWICVLLFSLFLDLAVMFVVPILVLVVYANVEVRGKRMAAGESYRCSRCPGCSGCSGLLGAGVVFFVFFSVGLDIYVSARG